MVYLPKTGHDPHDLDIMRASREALYRSYELLRATRPAVERFAGAPSRGEPAETQRNGERSCEAGRLPIRDDDPCRDSPGP